MSEDDLAAQLAAIAERKKSRAALASSEAQKLLIAVDALETKGEKEYGRLGRDFIVVTSFDDAFIVKKPSSLMWMHFTKGEKEKADFEKLIRVCLEAEQVDRVMSILEDRQGVESKIVSAITQMLDIQVGAVAGK